MTLSLDVALRRGAFELQARFSTQGRVTALFGRSGAGKSTLVGLVAGLIRPDAGRIALSGRVLFDAESGIDLRPPARRVGMVFQEPRLFPHLSVRRNLTYGRWAGWRRGGLPFDAVVDLLGLGALLTRRPGTLSGGEAQRVAIGRALLSAPDILLMDEPLSQLDGARRAEILPFLQRLAHEGNVPILYVSHAIDEVARLADTLVLVSEGRVAASGPIEEVLARIDLGPGTGRHEASALLNGRVEAHDEAFALTRVRVGGVLLLVPTPRGADPAPGSDVRLRVRARDVALSRSIPQDSSIRNVLPARILAVEAEEGAFAELLLEVETQRLRARITRHALDELALAPGQAVFALVKSVAVEHFAAGMTKPPPRLPPARSRTM